MVRGIIPPRRQAQRREGGKQQQHFDDELPDFEGQKKTDQRRDANPHGNGLGHGESGKKDLIHVKISV